MVIKALLKNGIIEPLELLDGVEAGLIEIEIKKYVNNKDIVNQTKGYIKLSENLVKEIAESEKILSVLFLF